MNILLVVLAIIASPFILLFVLGGLMASKQGSDKQRRARAVVALSQMTEEQRNCLLDIFSAYKENDTQAANKAADKASPKDVEFLANFFNFNNRPSEYKSGTLGMANWVVFRDKLMGLGYSKEVSKILPVVILDNYNEVLEKMIKVKQEKRRAAKVTILGEELDPDNQPKLYEWALRNPETLERQLKSIAYAWHEGSVRSAILALESDLNHG
jgi:hypothetical protein